MEAAKKIASLIVGMPKKDEAKEPNQFEMMAGDILSAIESKDAKTLASGLKAYFSAMETEPHEEYEEGE